MLIEAIGNTMDATTAVLWKELIQYYGYMALLIGASLEGETVVLLGGFSAYRRYISLSGVMVTVYCGAQFSDWLFFYLGRAQRHFILNKNPKWKKHVDDFCQRLMHYQNRLMFGRRFFYGLRNITSFAIGMSPVSTKRYLIINFLSVLVWAIAYSLVGYFFWNVLERLMGDLSRYEGRIILGVMVIILSSGAIQIYRFHRKTKG